VRQKAEKADLKEIPSAPWSQREMLEKKRDEKISVS